MQRKARVDQIIPLSTPQKTKTGETITALPVSKGQHIIMSIAAYNRLVALLTRFPLRLISLRLKAVWGEDADVWRPQRFLEGVNSN
jgi:hypothetical protein